MTAKTTATRAQAIAAAAALYAGEKNLDAWADREYTRGILEVLADTFGADVEDHDDARDAIWEEMRAEHARIERRAEAEQIAEDVETSYIPAVEQTEAVRDALIAAALAGMEAA